MKKLLLLLLVLPLAGCGGGSSSTSPSGGSSDTTAPTTPTNLQTTAVQASSVTLAWTASTDNVGVAGYRVSRNGSQVGTTSQTNYTDSNLTPGTTYAYAVAAYDAAGNVSGSGTSLSVKTASASGSSFPVKQSASKRYLVDQNGSPFMIVGDSSHSLFVNLTAADADTYFSNRAKYGVNAVWVEILCNDYTGGRTDGSTYDGILPLGSSNSLATPNDTYFQRVDAMVNLAAKYNINVLMDTIDTWGYQNLLHNSTSTAAYNYGVYLGLRYKNFPNIIWITGNDFRQWGSDATANANAAQIMKGIHDSDPNHLQTTELSDSVSGSLDDPQLVPYTTLAGAYSYYPTYAEVLDQYTAAAGAMPVFMEEATYEFASVVGNDGTPVTLRRAEYWTMLSGASGQMYGNYYVYPFNGPESPVNGNWQSNLDTPGVAQLKIMADFFNSVAWWNLVPDQNHQFVTGGYGTFSTGATVLGNDYVTAALTSDGKLGIAYIPESSTITVNLAKFSGSVTARWFDPSNATYTTIGGSPLANTASHQFSTPGSNNAGDGDWVLVLQSQ